MIQNIRQNSYQNWEDIREPTQEEILAKKAPVKFYATTTLSEKVSRLFNAAMFGIVGMKLLTFIPIVGSACTSLTQIGFAAISGFAIFQIPAVMTIMAIAPKIILGIACLLVIRKVASAVINCFVYPAVIISFMKRATYDKIRLQNFNSLRELGYECRRITLNKSGINYDAFAIQHAATKTNGQWVLVAGGNGWIGDSAIKNVAEEFSEAGFNVLYVNGPGVGRSTGLPTRYRIGAAQEAGLQFLETAVKANKILMYGTSLGGGAQAEAILNHRFKKDIQYMVWSDRSFDTLSNAASQMVSFLLKPVFFLLGIELDGLGGAKRLQKLGIKHVITQASQTENQQGVLPLEGVLNERGTDGVIPNNSSLYVGIRKAKLADSPRLKCFGRAGIAHNGSLPFHTGRLVQAEVQAFLNPVPRIA